MHIFQEVIMQIRKSDKLIELFLQKFSEYGQNIDEIRTQYTEKRNDFFNRAHLKQCTKEEIANYYDDYIEEEEKAIQVAEEKNKPITKILKKILQKFTQEMLCAIYEKCRNGSLKNEVFEQIRKNNDYIDSFNNYYIETGEIFEILENMTIEELERLNSLRENNEEININNVELQSISEQVKKMLLKVMNGYDLQEEKQEYCLQQGIKSESEFQMHKIRRKNQKLWDASIEAQQILNDLINAEDSSLINLARHLSNKIVIKNSKRN